MSAPQFPGCTVVHHPLVQSRMTTLRNRESSPEQFRCSLHELTTLLAYEATRNLKLTDLTFETPLASCQGHRLANPVTIVPILRAGLGMAEALWKVLPEARVGHVGMYRDKKTLEPKSYYFNAPPDLATTDVFLVDPMLATGNSAADAAAELKANGATSIRLLALVGCIAGLQRFREKHSDVPVFLAALDPELNDRAYIVPGLGDAGDRYFGT